MGKLRAMKTRLALAALVVFLGTATLTHAGGWRRGCGFYGGPRVSVGVGFGGGWGGYCGPRWGGWGWGGPRVGLGVVVAPRPVVVQRVVRTNGSLMASVQSQLRNLGYYDGAVDGVFGPMTSNALRRYQTDYGLVITGRLDEATIQSLNG